MKSDNEMNLSLFQSSSERPGGRAVTAEKLLSLLSL